MVLLRDIVLKSQLTHLKNTYEAVAGCKDKLIHKCFSSIFTADLPGFFQENLLLQNQQFSNNIFSGCLNSYYLTIIEREIQRMLKSFIKRCVARKYSLGDLVKSSSPILAVVILACLDFFPFTPSLSCLFRLVAVWFWVVPRSTKKDEDT